MNPRYIKKQYGDVIYFTFEHFDDTGLVNHCFTSKVGGYSSNNYESLNMGLNIGDDNFLVKQNHKLVADLLNAELESFVYSKQVHSTRIIQIKEGFNPIEDLKNICDVDGFITDSSNFTLHTVYADCVPVYILDPVNKVVGIAHSGWRGTVGKIGKELMKSLEVAFGSKPLECLAGIGPSIGPCCFEVGKEVTAEFEKVFTNKEDYLYKKKEKKDYLDLQKANVAVLIEAGIPLESIISADMCTCCNPEYFYSYRRDNGNTGRMAAILKLK